MRGCYLMEGQGLLGQEKLHILEHAETLGTPENSQRHGYKLKLQCVP